MCNCRAARINRVVVEPAPVPTQQTSHPLRRQRPAKPEPVVHDPVLWGPHMWVAMHTLAVFIQFGSAHTEWLELLTPLAVSLPCPECAGHYASWLAAHPLVVKRRQGPILRMMRRAAPAPEIDIGAWLLELHNAVNGRNGVAGWNLDAVVAAYGGDVGLRREAVRAAIAAVRGMIGARAIVALERLLARM